MFRLLMWGFWTDGSGGGGGPVVDVLYPRLTGGTIQLSGGCQ